MFATPVQAERVYPWTGLVGDPTLCGQKIFSVMIPVNTRLSYC